MTCKNYNELDQAVEYIKNNEPISEYVKKYKDLSRVLALIKKNINLFNITTNTISINEVFDEYFYQNFMQKYDFDELNEILIRDVDYSYFLYNVQDFNINLIDDPLPEEIIETESISITKEVIKAETSDIENDESYEDKVDAIKEDNVNRDVANGAHKVAPVPIDATKISKKYKRNPLLGKIAIQNAVSYTHLRAHETS